MTQASNLAVAGGHTQSPGYFITSGTSQATTSGTAVDFSVPSWAKRITVMYSGVSTNSTSAMLVQIGSGGTPVNTGYVGVVAGVSGATSASATLSDGFKITRVTTAANTYQGICVITNITGNTWTASWNTADSSLLMQNGAGTLALSGTLNIVRFTSSTPDTFDAGTVNILYEG